jgi:hypothetical protein
MPALGGMFLLPRIVGLAQLPQFEGVRVMVSVGYGKSRHYTSGVWARPRAMRRRSGSSKPSRSSRAV